MKTLQFINLPNLNASTMKGSAVFLSLYSMYCADMSPTVKITKAEDTFVARGYLSSTRV